jgi:cyclic lactone autoinducer peptide
VKKKLLKAMAYGISAFGLLAAGASSVGCWVIFMDEPNMPKSLIEK